MNKFIITTENTCDLNKEYLTEHNIRKINLHYYLDGVEYPSDDFVAKDFYGQLRKGRKGTTSQPNAYEFETFFNGLLSEGYDVLHLSFSSVLSGTYANACAVAKRVAPTFPGRLITVIDSKCQSAGQGLFVTLVSRYKEEGHSYEECIAYAESMIQRINHLFTVDDLRCLAATGRVSNAEAFIGNILQIKPLLYTNADGKLTPYTRLISRKLALNGLADKIKSKYDGDEKNIFITHSDCRTDAQYIADRLKAGLPDITVTLFDLNPVIGCHTGADTIAVFFTAPSRNIR